MFHSLKNIFESEHQYIMNLYQFNALDEAEQAEAVWDSIHIGERQDEEHNILLYHRDDFYIVFNHREYNVIRRIKSFINT